jgi:hypothetical protein
VLVTAAIRRDEVPTHRRWMIRAFAVGVGVGTIRIWIGLSLHVLAADWWIRTTPDKTG